MNLDKIVRNALLVAKPVFVFLVLGSSPVFAGSLTLVKDGKPNATIVVQAGAAKRIHEAGADLQKYLQKITGVELPLKTDGKDVPGITLNIGKTESSLPDDFPDPGLHPEAYAIRQRDDDLYLTGNFPTSTAFAVYSFLQDQLGVRWFAPGDDWEYLPEHDDRDSYTVEVKEVLSVPETSPRIWIGHDWFDSWKAWSVRNKVVVNEKIPWRGAPFNVMSRIFPPSKYGKTNPEYYPLVNGKRWIPVRDTQRIWWPCFGSKDVQRITVEYLRQWFLDHPEEASVSLGLDDTAYLCGCPLCLAMDAAPDDYENRRYSSRYYKFINLIAGEIKKSNPDRYIGMLIYDHVVEPPVDVPKMEENTFGYIADGRVAQWYLPGKKEEWIANTREWSRRVAHLSRYDYYGLATFAPRVFPHSMYESMKIDRSLGFGGVHLEMYTFLPQTAPMIWAYAQLQWKFEGQSVDDLLEEFYAKMYGPAAPVMKRYFDLMEESWNTLRPGHDSLTTVNRNIIAQASSISPEAALEGIHLLNQAYDLAQTALEKRRIDVTRNGLLYANYAISGYAQAQELSALPVRNATEAEEKLVKAEKFGNLMRERDLFWVKARERDDLLGETLRGLYGKKLHGGTSYLETNTTPLDSPALPGVVQLVEWYGENQPEKAGEVLQRVEHSFSSGDLRRTVGAWNWVRKHQPVSLISNGDFEETAKYQSTGKNAALATNDDWSAKEAPVGWWTWSREKQARFTVAPGKVGNGFRIQSNEGRGDHGVLIQNVAVNPVKRYIGSVWIRSERADQAASATITLFFRDKKGFHKGQNSKVVAGASPGVEWQHIILSSDVPQGATGVSVMLGVKRGDAVFSNVALYEIPKEGD